MSESYWDHIEKAYNEVNLNSKPKVIANCLSKYPEYVVNLLAAHWLLSEVANGGMIQFLFNQTGVLTLEVEKAFNKIDLQGVAELITHIISKFGKEFPLDTRLRQKDLLKMAQVKNENDLFDSNFFTDIENILFSIGGNDFNKIYDRMDEYAYKSKK